MTEKEINEKYPQLAASLGQRIYTLCLPLIEIVDHLSQMLHMNREMAKIKGAEALQKAEEAKKNESKP